MEWIKKLRKSDSQVPPDVIAVDEAAVHLDAFKCHWLQINDIISATKPRPAFIRPNQKHDLKIENITADDVEAVKNLLEKMIFLLIEEQCSGQLVGPILDFTITQGVFEKLADWCEGSSTLKQQMLLHLLKVYEVLISQAQQPLLHQKQLVSPMLRILSFSQEPQSEELDGHMVLLLNLLCVWMHRDPTLVEVFFNASSNHGPAKFLIFSLLIEYIHREGTVGQQARDALLLCMALSAENETVAKYIIENSNFCPVLATGLSALYSTLPRHMEVRADDWHCLQRNDWAQVPELQNFMNSFEFCNSVVEVAHSLVSDQLLEYFYNGFLVSVFGPSLHKKSKSDSEQPESKTSAGEVVVTTAYLNLFLRSVTAPALMRCFLQFLLTHRHDSSLIINTLIQRIASTNRLALVSLSLIRTLVDLNCEDLMLQLVFRYLIPCQHLLASQRRSIRDVDIYNASASRFLALTPAVCVSEPTSKDDDILQPIKIAQDYSVQTTAAPEPTSPASPSSPTSSDSDNGNSAFHSLSPPPPMHVESSFQYQSPNQLSMPPDVHHATSAFTVNEDLSVTISMHPATSAGPTVEMTSQTPKTITSPRTMAEFGPDLNSQLDLNTSYMDYLEDAKYSISQCREACSGWSSSYDGRDPVEVASAEEISKLEKTNKECEPEKKENKSETASESIPTNDTPQDVLQSQSTPTNGSPLDALQSANDPAMKALSVTYQTLNLTALAKQHSNSFSSVETTGSEFKPVNCSGTPETIKSGDVTESQNVEVAFEKERVKDVEQCDIVIVNENTTNAGKLETTATDGEDFDKTSLENASSLLSFDDLDKRPRSGTTSTSTSSVDDFFRSLMEIVPASSKDKLSLGKTSNKSDLSKLEEDFESGIEVSSDGDNQNNKDLPANLTDKDSDQNEDSMSQLSLNTDEITEKDAMKLPEENAFDDAEVQRTFSFADDVESEYDDTTSIASSSFYEAADEYGPTEMSVSPSVPLRLQGIPYTGPLIGNLFAKLDQMMNNSLYENLLLTGIVARLAVYPQPILRSFLLNTHMVFHPNVKSLYQVLNSARNKIDAYASEISDFKILVRRAQKYLLARGTYPFSGDARNRNSIQDRPMPVPKVKTRTLGGMFRRKPRDVNKKKSILPSLETLLERRPRSSSKDKSRSSSQGTDEEKTSQHSSLFYIRQHIMQQHEQQKKKLQELRTKNAVYASIVLAEFLKELAAIAQEHAVAGFAG